MMVIIVGGSAIRGALQTRRGAGPTPTTLGRIADRISRSASPPALDSLAGTLPGGHDVLVGIRDGERRRLARFDAASGAPRWQGETLQTSRMLDEDHIAFDDQRVYLADQRSLLALRLGDGATAWRASLMAEVATGCSGCVRAMGERLQEDGSLQALDAGSGRLVWEVKVRSVPREVVVFDGRVVVPRQTQGRRSSWHFDLLDPADGKATVSIDASCTSIRSFPLERPTAYSPRLFDEASKSMFIQFGDFRHCVQRWDMEHGKMLWGLNTGDAGIGKLALVGGGLVLLDAEKALRAIDARTGTLRTLLQTDDQVIKPIIARDDVVVVTATASWDHSERFAVWGLEPATGRRLWQFASGDKPEKWNGIGAWWSVQDGSAGVVVARVVDEKQLALDTLDRKTGATDRKTINLANGIWRPYWGAPVSWLQSGQSYYGVDLAAGRIAYHVP
jgi:outer membrane protein assembly factor BamB